MRDDARRLLGAMADDKVDGLLAQLQRGARSEAELRSALGLTHRATYKRLIELRALGVIASSQRAGEGKGRPAREWRLTHQQLLARLTAQAEAAAGVLRGIGGDV